MTRILGPIFFLFSMFIFLCYITVPDKTWVFSKGFHNVYSSLLKWLEKIRISFFVVVPLLNVQCPYHTETNQLTWSANQLTGFCVIGALDVNCFTLGLGKNYWKLIITHWNNLIGFWNSCSKSDKNIHLWNLFKINNKGIRTASIYVFLVSLFLTMSK